MATIEDLERARNAISSIESGGKYGITGPIASGGAPLGRYQILSSNLPLWSAAALGRSVSPQEFLASPDIQDAIFNHRFGGYLDKYGPEGAARAWFGGEGAIAPAAGARRDMLGTSVNGYAKRFMAAFAGGPRQAEGNPFDQFDAAPPRDGASAPGEGANPFDQFDGVSDAAALPAERKSYALADVPGEALKHVGSDAAQVWDDIARAGSDAVNDPAGVAKRVGDGLWGSAVSAVLPDVKAVLRAAGVPTAGVDAWGQRQGAGGNPLDPIGSPEKLRGAYEDAKRDVAERPVSTAANLAAVVAPGAGGVGRAGLRAVTGAADIADRALAPTVGKALTGVSGDLQREALRAGEAGGTRGREFRGQLTGAAPADRVVTLAHEAEDAINQRGIDGRNATIAGGAGASAPPNTPARLQAALQTARQGNRDVAGIVQSAEAEEVLNALQRHLDDAFPAGRPRNAAVLSVEGLDALKRRIGGELADRGLFESGGTAGRLGGDVYNAVKQAIVDAYPEYAPGMERAEQGIRELQQVQRQLSLRSPNSATTGGKLQQAARNDAHSAYGMRREALETLRAERPELVSALAGQALGSMSPRGMTPWLALGHAMYSPHTAVAHYLASVPRLHGEVRYALGATIRGARRIGATQRNAGNLLDALRLAGAEDDR